MSPRAQESSGGAARAELVALETKADPRGPVLSTRCLGRTCRLPARGDSQAEQHGRHRRLQARAQIFGAATERLLAVVDEIVGATWFLTDRVLAAAPPRTSELGPPRPRQSRP